MDRVAIDVLGSLPEPERLDKYIQIAIDCLSGLRPTHCRMRKQSLLLDVLVSLFFSVGLAELS